jgi:hypothetical protein
MTDKETLNDDDIKRLTQGTLINGDIPDRYDPPSEQYESYFELFNNGVMIREPETEDTTFTMHPEGVPERGTASIDFFYGRPVLYLHEPLSEEPAYMLALPTKEDPYIRPMKHPGERFGDTIERVENDTF